MLKRAKTAGGRVEEHVAFGEAVLLLVAVDREPIERRARRPADERNFDDVRALSSPVASSKYTEPSSTCGASPSPAMRRRDSSGSIWQRRGWRSGDCGRRIADCEPANTPDP